MYKNPKAHREDIVKTVNKLFRAKYDRGQKEHGGKLYDKPQMPELVNETLDFLSYTFTLRKQLEEVERLLSKAIPLMRLETKGDCMAAESVDAALNILHFGNAQGKSLED